MPNADLDRLTKEQMDMILPPGDPVRIFPGGVTLSRRTAIEVSLAIHDLRSTHRKGMIYDKC